MSTYEKSQRFNTVKEQMKHLKEKFALNDTNCLLTFIKLGLALIVGGLQTVLLRKRFESLV